MIRLAFPQRGNRLPTDAATSPPEISPVRSVAGIYGCFSNFASPSPIYAINAWSTYQSKDIFRVSSRAPRSFGSIGTSAEPARRNFPSIPSRLGMRRLRLPIDYSKQYNSFSTRRDAPHSARTPAETRGASRLRGLAMKPGQPAAKSVPC